MGSACFNMAERSSEHEHNRDGSFRGNRLKMIGRAAVALVWLYQGLWCKLLARCPSHAAVVASLPEPLGAVGGLLLISLGAIEVLLAAWVLSGRAARLAAASQTVLLVAMNVGGLIWGRAAILDPGGMIVQNLAFLTLVWIVTAREVHA
jgi:uncharacterized membrane protein YphA (DoxX/SURF4 family)